jgi:hypothetical protein
MTPARMVRPELVEWANRAKLEAMPVHEFVTHFVQ